MAYVAVITLIATIMGIIAASMSIAIGIWRIIEATKKPKGNEKQQQRKYFKMEKNAVILAPFPLVKSPKGYIYEINQHPKKRTLYCGNCYTTLSKLTPLKKVGSFSPKKVICHTCKTIYKK